MIPVEIVGPRFRRVHHVPSPRDAFRFARRELRLAAAIECRFRNGGFVTRVTSDDYRTWRDPAMGIGNSLHEQGSTHGTP